jgi:hypothetical protein
VWALVLRPQVPAVTSAACLVGAALVLAAGFLPGVLTGTAVVAGVVGAVVATLVVTTQREAAPTTP